MAAAGPKVIDFRLIEGKPKSLNPKQIRARARRLHRKHKSPGPELELLYKPIEEWDMEELARGRPRTIAGDFRGRPPTWVSRALYEQAMDRFKVIMRQNVNKEAAGAIDIIHALMVNEDKDDKGKALVPPSVKLDAAKWLTEHVIGKPTQRIEQDISVKLQAVLAQVMAPVGSSPMALGPINPVIKSTADTSDVWDVEGEEGDVDA